MKTVFVVNPKAGNGKNIDRLVCDIKQSILKTGKDADIYITKAKGDGERFVREYCKAKGPARFIACGGDGTLNEVLNGAVLCSDAEIGVIPVGTGNDFIRNFGTNKDFYDITSQLTGNSVKCDAICYRQIGKSQNKRFCANMFNIGFDCNVADMAQSIKKKVISGPLSYLCSVFVNLTKKKGANLTIETDGERTHKGELLLTSLANGKYCGGGIKSNPEASLSDGMMSINIIYNISRLNFLSKLPFYMKGIHTKLKNIEKVIYSKKCKKVVITPKEKMMKLCTDGEISLVGKTEFEVVHNAFNFVVPDILEKV